MNQSRERGATINVKVVTDDLFAAFAQQTGVMAYSELLDALRGGDSAVDLSDVKVVPGQGLSSDQLRFAEDIAARQGHDSAFELWRAMAPSAPAPREQTHKRRPENAVISAPERVDGQTYVANLCINKHNEMLQDHQTGQHIQGMLLIEACRQMFLAVSEAYLLPEAWQSRGYFVIHGMDVSFHNFAFPLPADIRFSAREVDDSRDECVSVRAEIEVRQARRAGRATEAVLTRVAETAARHAAAGDEENVSAV